MAAPASGAGVPVAMGQPRVAGGGGGIIKGGTPAPGAGAAIHMDFEEKFIRAEVIFWEDLLTAGSYAHARERGLLRTEGRDYIVNDGDVIEFKI